MPPMTVYFMIVFRNANLIYRTHFRTGSAWRKSEGHETNAPYPLTGVAPNNRNEGVHSFSSAMSNSS